MQMEQCHRHCQQTKKEQRNYRKYASDKTENAISC